MKHVARETCWSCLTSLVLLLSSPAGSSQETQTEKRVQDLIRQLSSQKYAERQRAMRELEDIGAPAVGPLRDALAGADLESTQRIRALLVKLAPVAHILAARPVHLKLNQVTVKAAVQELAEQSGYAFELWDPECLLFGKAVVLDTGKTFFWDALEQLCVKCGLAVLENRFEPQELRVGRFDFIHLSENWKKPARSLDKGQFVLFPARVQERDTSYCGSLRLQLLPCRWFPDLPERFKDPRETAYVLETSAEPRVVSFALTEPLRVSAAVTSVGESLPVIVESWPGGQSLFGYNPRLVDRQIIRIQHGKKPAQILKKLTGQFRFRAPGLPEPLVITNKGKFAAPDSSYSLRIDSTGKHVSADIGIEFAGHEPLGDSLIYHGSRSIVFRHGEYQLHKATISEFKSYFNGDLFQEPWFVSAIDGAGKDVPLKRVHFYRSLAAKEGRMRVRESVGYTIESEITPVRFVLFGQKMHEAEARFAFANVSLLQAP